MANNKVIGMDDIIGTLFAIQEEIKATDNTLRNSSFFQAIETLRMGLVTNQHKLGNTLMSTEKAYNKVKITAKSPRLLAELDNIRKKLWNGNAK